MNSVLKPAESKKCKCISEATKKLRTAVKKTRESGYSVSCKSRGMDTFRDLQKHTIGAMYYQMSMKKRELTVIDITNITCCHKIAVVEK